jgi:photosystem II stability/assembly factor-like uncharacterized protein
MTLGAMSKISRNLLIVLAISLLGTTGLWAGQWTALGPDGGDVRSFAYNPQNPDQIFLGTSTGVIFVSHDSGHNWTRFAHLGNGDDYVLDHIVVDPRNPSIMYVSAWSLESQQSGDVFRTRNGGKSWEVLPDMHSKSVRAMAVAASDSKTLVAGALDGVYRSNDGGNSWQRISPANHAEIKNIESVAIDPKNPSTVYAGTWHLAWKTDDGGANWHHINKGMIDDSDVFSIIVDQNDPTVVFASACSGIYKSSSAGEQFQKIQGIPFSARRTRVLKGDPSNSSIVYAGTTEGLWKTMDQGKTWRRVSNPEVVVNDVLVDPRNSQRLLLATDRSGVLASDDGAQSFSASNHGYTHRYVSSILADQKDAETIYAGVVNDREFGGVFYSHDGGQHWLQKSAGLGGRDVFSLKQTSSGALVAGTNRGIFMLEHNAAEWRPINTIIEEKTTYRTVKKGSKTTKVASKTATRSVLEARVSDLEIESGRWLAATSAGLFVSTDQGKMWKGGSVMGQQDFVSVRESGETVVAATRAGVLVSTDKGTTWKEARLASYTPNVRGVTMGPDGQIYVACREGAFRSSDSGATWEHMMAGLPDKDITSIVYDSTHKRLLATSYATGVVFESTNGGQNWKRGPDSGYPMRRISVVRGRLVAATPFDGVIMQPENESQSASAQGSGGSSN